MSKSKAAVRRTSNEIQHQVEFDDSPLPNPSELLAYKEIDETLVTYLKAKADIEQEARIKIINSEIFLKESAQQKAFAIDKITLFAALTTIIAGMGSTVYLAILGNYISSSILGGVTLITAIKSFLNFRTNPKHN